MCLTCRLRYDRDGVEIDALVYAMTEGAGSDDQDERGLDDLMAAGRKLMSRLQQLAPEQAEVH